MNSATQQTHTMDTESDDEMVQDPEGSGHLSTVDLPATDQPCRPATGHSEVSNTNIEGCTGVLKVDRVSAVGDVNITPHQGPFIHPWKFWFFIVTVIVGAVAVILEKNIRRIKLWTDGMVNTSALDKVMEKLREGITWITIRGSPGQGKTTTAYMALDQLHRSGRQVFQAFTPGDFTEITRTYSQPVIMLDDILGRLEFDPISWIGWKPVLQEILELKDQSHRSKDGMVEPTIVLVGRDYVLHSARVHMGRLYDFIVQDMYVVDMSHKVDRTHEEKERIWKAVVQANGISLNEDKITRILDLKGNHGFPHVCRLFVTMYQSNPDIDTELFFKTPLKFLSDTVELLLNDDFKRTLFEALILKQGKATLRELQNVNSSHKVIKAAEELNGTYLRFEEGYFVFDHPSIYDSVAFSLCKYKPLFVIENCNLSFIHERIRLDLSHGSVPQHDLVVSVPQIYIPDLAGRFSREILLENLYLVLSHQACTDKGFIETMMSYLPLRLTKLVQLSDSITEEDFLSFIASNKSPELLMYIDAHKGIRLTQYKVKAILHGACKYAASQVLTYLVQNHHSRFDINVTYGVWKQSPLMIAAETRDDQFVHQIMALNPDLNARDETRHKKAVLHYLCEYGLLSAVRQVIERLGGTEVNDRRGRSPLYYACRSNRVEVARLLLDRGARLDGDAVAVAAERGNLEVLKLLFERGATLDMESNMGIFHSACSGGHMKVIKYLIDKGASVDTIVYNMSPLHVACLYNKPQSVEFLLEHGASIDIRDKRGFTPLHLAAKTKYIDCIDVLLKAKADVNAQSRNGYTPVYLVVSRRYKKSMEVLLQAGADVNLKNNFGYTPLHIAAEMGYSELFDMLLQAEADMNAQDTNGQTPLHKTATNGCKHCMDILLDAGADFNIKSFLGDTPLHAAAENGCKQCLSTLLKAGADPDIKNEQGSSALYIASHSPCEENKDVSVDVGDRVVAVRPLMKLKAVQRSEECVDMLLRAGADVNVQNKDGLTPLHQAVSYRLYGGASRPDIDTSKTLMKHGADVNKQDRDGNTPLHYLCRVNYESEIVRKVHKEEDTILFLLLIKYGADVNIRNKEGEPALPASFPDFE